MNNKLRQALAAFKALLADEGDAPQKYTEMKTKDGVTYRTAGELFSLGNDIEVQGEGDEWTPAPDGTVEMENGQSWVIKEGKLSEILEVETPDPATAAPVEAAEEAPDGDAPADAPADEVPEVVTIDMYNDLLARVEALEAATSAAFKVATEEAVSRDEKFKAMAKLVEVIAGEKSEPSTEGTKHNFYKTLKDEKNTARENLKAAILGAKK